MVGLNRVTLIGHTGRDPEMRYTPDGKPVTSFSLAVTTKHGGSEETTWFTVSCWQGLAEMMNQYLTKGRQVFCDGRLRHRQWEGKDGVMHSGLEVIADRVLLLGPKVQGKPEMLSVEDGSTSL